MLLALPASTTVEINHGSSGLGRDRVSQIRVSIAIANSTAVALQTHCIQYERFYFPFFVEEVTEKVLA